MKKLFKVFRTDVFNTWRIVMGFQNARKGLVFKTVSLIQAAIFIFSSIALPAKTYAQSVSPVPVMATHGEVFSPAVLRGFKIDPNNPLLFDFIVDKGDSLLQGQPLEVEGKKLIKYFLTALTVPSKDLWVNLSPYENNRIVPEKFGQTEMGRDLLAEDYALKQLTASLMYPETDLGKEFWAKVYARAQKEFGTTEIPIDTFNKVWIMPDKARVYEKGNNVYLVDARMKVMLQEDYVALENNKVEGTAVVADKYNVSRFASDIVRDVIVPEITREVNEGKNFASLRQVHYSLVLAAWYEKKVRETILGKTFASQNKIAGNESDDPQAKDKIYAQYVEAFKKGAYSYIKEDIDANTQEVVPRKYFSGGYKGDKAEIVDNTQTVGEVPGKKDGLVSVKADLAATNDVGEGAKPLTVEQLVTTKAGLNDKGLDANEQKILNIGKLDGLKKKEVVHTAYGDVQVYLVADNVLGNLGYGFDRDHKAVVVSKQLIKEAMQVLKDEQSVLEVVATEYFSDEKTAYELALERLKAGVTKKALFAYEGGSPEEMVANAAKEFDIPENPVQEKLEARASEMAGDRKMGPATAPVVVMSKGVVDEDPVTVNKTAREAVAKSAYAIGLRTLLGLLEVLPVEKLADLSKLVSAGKSLTMMIMPSKWAPPTQAHSTFVFKVSALMAGVQPAGKFGKQTLAILPNVTKIDNRKPIIFTTYDARNTITHEMLAGLMAETARVLESDDLYADKNGEETVVEIVTRLLIDYVNAHGAKIVAPKKAGQIDSKLVAKVNAALLKGFLLRLLYQVGSDHYKTFSLSKQGFVAFGKINDVNREDQLYWARLNPARYKQLIMEAGAEHMIDPSLPDAQERQSFLDNLNITADDEVFSFIEKATYLPLLDTIGKYTIASSLYGDAADFILVHIFRGADYMADQSRDELIARGQVKVLNTEGFDAPVAATFVRQGLQELYLTGVFNYNKLGIVTRSVRSAILKNPKMIELLLRQDATPNKEPKTFFPATPGIAMVAKAEQGTALENPVKERKEKLAAKYGVTGIQEILTAKFETELTFKGAELVYRIGILYHDDGTPKNVYDEIFALPGEDKDVLDRMRAYARELNAVDAAQSRVGEEANVEDGVDQDFAEVNKPEADFKSNEPSMAVRNEVQPKDNFDVMDATDQYQEIRGSEFLSPEVLDKVRAVKVLLVRDDKFTGYKYSRKEKALFLPFYFKDETGFDLITGMRIFLATADIAKKKPGMTKDAYEKLDLVAMGKGWTAVNRWAEAVFGDKVRSKFPGLKTVAELKKPFDEALWTSKDLVGLQTMAVELLGEGTLVDDENLQGAVDAQTEAKERADAMWELIGFNALYAKVDYSNPHRAFNDVKNITDYFSAGQNSAKFNPITLAHLGVVILSAFALSGVQTFRVNVSVFDPRKKDIENTYPERLDLAKADIEKLFGGLVTIYQETAGKDELTEKGLKTWNGEEVFALTVAERVVHTRIDPQVPAAAPGSLGKQLYTAGSDHFYIWAPDKLVPDMIGFMDVTDDKIRKYHEFYVNKLSDRAVKLLIEMIEKQVNIDKSKAGARSFYLSLDEMQKSIKADIDQKIAKEPAKAAAFGKKRDASLSGLDKIRKQLASKDPKENLKAIAYDPVKRQAVIKALIDAKNDANAVREIYKTAEILPNMDTALKLLLIQSSYPEVEIVFGHTNRKEDLGADQFRDEIIDGYDPLRDQIIKDQALLKVENIKGFEKPFSATKLRMGLIKTVYSFFNKYKRFYAGYLYGASGPLLRKLFKERKKIETLLFQEGLELPHVIQGLWDPVLFETKNQFIKSALLKSGEVIKDTRKDFEVSQDDKYTPGETTIALIRGDKKNADATVVYTVFGHFNDEGHKEYAVKIKSAEGKIADITLLINYINGLNRSLLEGTGIDFAEASSDAAAIAPGRDQKLVEGGVDFDLGNVDMDVQSDGTGVQLNFDPAMLRDGHFNGLVPVIRSITPITDLPMFLGAKTAEPALAGVAG